MVLKWYPMSKNLEIYIGLLHVLLVILNSPASTGQPGVQCFNDSECDDDKACIAFICSDLCMLSGHCGCEATCTMVGHSPTCRCPDGFIGEATEACFPPTCDPNEDGTGGICLSSEACKIAGGFSIGRCAAGLYTCCAVTCERDEQCPSELACRDSKCSNPCEDPEACGLNAVCTVVDREAECSCPTDLPQGDPYVDECVECETNTDCLDTSQVCDNETCVDPCEVSPCGLDAECTVVDRASTCNCREGFTGDPFSACFPAIKECKFEDDCPSKLACRCREGGDFDCIDLPCNCDDNCPDNLACIDSSCSDPCENPEECGLQATCTVVEHEPVCDCPPDFTGDPSDVCFPTNCDSSSSDSDAVCFTSEEECSNQGGIPTGTCASGFGVCCLRKACDSNTDCPSNLACIDSYCSNPCGNLKTCGFHAMCAVHNHHPYCFCPDHYTGNASDICYPTRCKSACGLPGDCLSREACAKQYGIPNGSCASGLGVCCLDSKYCDHPGYINKLSCKNRRPQIKYTPSRDAEVDYTKKNLLKV